MHRTFTFVGSITVQLVSSLTKKEHMLLFVYSETDQSKLVKLDGDQLYSDTSPNGECSLRDDLIAFV